MEKATIVVVHSDPEVQRRIATSLAPIRHPVLCTREPKDLITVTQRDRRRVGLIVTSDVRIPFERPHVVERLQRESLRVPVIVLVDEPAQANVVKPTQLLTGLQQVLVWPEEEAGLVPVARGLLRAAHFLDDTQTQPGDPGWISNLRQVGTTLERSDLIAALRATSGNISRAAALLGISRGGLQYRLHKYFHRRGDCGRNELRAIAESKGRRERGI